MTKKTDEDNTILLAIIIFLLYIIASSTPAETGATFNYQMRMLLL